MTTKTKPSLPCKAYGMTSWQLAAWEADVAVGRIPEPSRFTATWFKSGTNGTDWDGYFAAETLEGIGFVRGWLIGRESIA